jgi:uncharacterized membrane protein
VSWATYVKWLKLDGPSALFDHVASIALFTVLAVAELVADICKKRLREQS